nr:hypothetical protein [Lacticaseibacillus manihotivorans]
MTVEASLTYQQTFFQRFRQGLAGPVDVSLVSSIDKTASSLRLEVTETPGYILAYDKGAQDELHDFLQKAFVAFLREHVPFFLKCPTTDKFILAIGTTAGSSVN